MGKKSKKDKNKDNITKIIDFKTQNERLLEVEQLKVQIENLGLSDNFEGIDIFYQKLDTYVVNGIPQSGQIKLPGLKRIIEFSLTNQKHKKNSVNLKYSEQT